MNEIGTYVALLMKLNGTAEYRAFYARVTRDERGEILYLTSGNFELRIDLELILNLIEVARHD